MIEKELLDLRDIVSTTVENLISTTVDVRRRLMIVNLFGKKEIELSIAELQSHQNSCRDFIKYLKEKLNE